MKSKVVALSFMGVVVFSSASFSVTNEVFTKLLGKYCMPMMGTACISDELSYFSDEKCICRSDSRIWNTESRICENCPEGTFPYKNEKCMEIACPAGSYKVAVVDVNKGCPAGTYKIEKTIECPAGSYKVDYHATVVEEENK